MIEKCKKSESRQEIANTYCIDEREQKINANLVGMHIRERKSRAFGKTCRKCAKKNYFQAV